MSRRIFEIVLAVLLLVASVFSEIVHPVQLPKNQVILGSVLDLNDDVYSLDARLYGELSVRRSLSFFFEGAYRFFSIQYELTPHGHLHEFAEVGSEGLNGTILGGKISPLDHFGLALAYRFPAENESSNERFPRLSIETLYEFPITSYLLVGYSVEYQTFLERTNFQPGDEVGSKLSFRWLFPQWHFNYVLLFRKRIEESRNYNLAKFYQKMDDAYRGVRIRYEFIRVYELKELYFKPGVAYDVSAGTLFGFEIGHRLECFLMVEW